MPDLERVAKSLRRDLVRYWYGRLGPKGDALLCRLDPREAFRQEMHLRGRAELAQLSDEEIDEGVRTVAKRLRRVTVTVQEVTEAFADLARIVRRSDLPYYYIGPERQLTAGGEK